MLFNNRRQSVFTTPGLANDFSQIEQEKWEHVTPANVGGSCQFENGYRKGTKNTKKLLKLSGQGGNKYDRSYENQTNVDDISQCASFTQHFRKS